MASVPWAANARRVLADCVMVPQPRGRASAAGRIATGPHGRPAASREHSHHFSLVTDRYHLMTDGRSHCRWPTTAALMHRAFAVDVLACPGCGGRLRLIATLHDPAVIRKLLAHLGMARSGPSPGPAPPESGAAAP